MALWALAIAGAQMQTILDNPLASPFTLGISAAASFGAALALVLGVSIVPVAIDYLVPANAFVAAAGAALLIHALSQRRGVTTETVVLLGIALVFTFNALLSLLQFVASEQALGAASHLAKAEPADQPGQHHVLGCVELREQVVELEDEAQLGVAELGQRVRIAREEILALEEHAAPRRPVERAQHVQQGRLPDAGASQHRELLARRDSQIDPAQHLELAERLVQGLDADDVLGHRAPPPPR